MSHQLTFKEHTVSHKTSSLGLTWTSISVFQSSPEHKTITSVNGNTPFRSGELNCQLLSPCYNLPHIEVILGLGAGPKPTPYIHDAL